MPPKLDKGRGNKRQVQALKTNDVADRIQKSITEKFTDEQLAEFRDLFNMFDKENQGSTLTPNVLAAVMKAVGQTPTESDMIDLMREMDLDHSGTIDFYEFVTMISHRMRPNESQNEIRKAFALFDRNQDGLITFDDLKATMEKYLPPNVTNEHEIRQMIELGDRTGNNAVSFEDFHHAAMCQTDRKQNASHP